MNTLKDCYFLHPKRLPNGHRESYHSVACELLATIGRMAYVAEE